MKYLIASGLLSFNLFVKKVPTQARKKILPSINIKATHKGIFQFSNRSSSNANSNKQAQKAS
jgi:hypothetical protein